METYHHTGVSFSVLSRAECKVGGTTSVEDKRETNLARSGPQEHRLAFLIPDVGRVSRLVQPDVVPIHYCNVHHNEHGRWEQMLDVEKFVDQKWCSRFECS